MLIDGLAQAYHWSYHELITLTMPQIVMLTHASHVNKLAMDTRIKKERVDGNYSTLENAMADSPIWDGKRLTEMTSDEYIAYHRSAISN